MNDLLVVNIGNTRTQVGVWRSRAVHDMFMMPTAVLQQGAPCPAAIARYSNLSCSVASVVPAATERLCEVFPANRICVVSPEHIVDVDFSAVRAATVGADRLANIVAGLHMLPPPVIVLDCGTAITLEVVDSRRRFLGGAILPGREMMRRALSAQTAQLPYVPLTHLEPDAVGNDTIRAICSGVDSGVLGAVERLVARTRADLSAPDVPVIAAGGDARYFKKAFPSFVEASETFTLIGVGLIGQACL
ncbi:MAG: type III pantothenate kinase [Candidatus Pacebacteria bacterium]|nr:type III pantothenate kinase [Candidatus Paceibacterota bacterium]